MIMMHNKKKINVLL